MNELEEIRSKGLAYSNGEAVQGICCVAALICNNKGEAVAAMSISIPLSRITDDLWQKANEYILQGSKDLSLNLYYQPNNMEVH